MKSIIISLIAILLSFAFVTTSAIVTHKMLDDLLDDIKEARNADEYDIISEKFERFSRFLSLTLSDNSLCEIEYSILEVRDYLSHGSDDEATAAKSRLVSKIREHKRLSGINPRSIF